MSIDSEIRGYQRPYLYSIELTIRILNGLRCRGEVSSIIIKTFTILPYSQLQMIVIMACISYPHSGNHFKTGRCAFEDIDATILYFMKFSPFKTEF